MRISQTDRKCHPVYVVLNYKEKLDKVMFNAYPLHAAIITKYVEEKQ